MDEDVKAGVGVGRGTALARRQLTQQTTQLDNMPTDLDITAIILAGGQATRMGGEDKGLILLDGRPMLEHVLERIRPQVDQIIINANRNQETYDDFGWPVISDNDRDYRGPLSGIAAVMQLAASRYFVSVPCDAPLLPRDLTGRLHDALEGTSAVSAVADSGESIQPVFALFKKSAEPALKHFIQAGESKVRLWHRQNSSIVVDFSDTPEAFLNINTPKQLHAIEARLRNR